MSKAQPSVKEQDAVRICRFCDRQFDYYRRDESGLGVCPRMRRFFSEWCSKECFWNDFLAQAKAEMTYDPDRKLELKLKIAELTRRITEAKRIWERYAPWDS